MTNESQLEGIILSRIMELASRRRPTTGKYRNLTKTYDSRKKFAEDSVKFARDQLKSYRRQKDDSLAVEALVGSGIDFCLSGYFRNAYAVFERATRLQGQNEMAKQFLDELAEHGITAEGQSNFQSMLDLYVSTYADCEELAGTVGCQQKIVTYEIGKYIPPDGHFLSGLNRTSAMLFHVDGSCSDPQHAFKGAFVVNSEGINSYYPLSVPGERTR